MPGRRQGRRKNRVLSTLVSGLPPDSYQKRPYFPDLLHQPDLLLVPELGRLVVLFVYEVEQHVGWGRALAWLEDLIEVKLNVGEFALTSGLVITDLENDTPTAQPDIGQMLRNTFDGFFMPNDWKVPFAANTLRERLIGSERNSALSQFLAGEREQISTELRRFDEERYRPLVDKERVPELPATGGEDRIVRLIRESVEVPVELSRFVPNVKGYLARLPRAYKFKFDIWIPGHEGLAIDILQSRRYGSRERLRYLMAKGRLLRYGFDGERIRPRGRDIRPALIVDGNISGPDHDPYRYVRALISVGWELFSVDQIAHLRELL